MCRSACCTERTGRIPPVELAKEVGRRESDGRTRYSGARANQWELRLMGVFRRSGRVDMRALGQLGGGNEVREGDDWRSGQARCSTRSRSAFAPLLVIDTNAHPCSRSWARASQIAKSKELAQSRGPSPHADWARKAKRGSPLTSGSCSGVQHSLWAGSEMFAGCICRNISSGHCHAVITSHQMLPASRPRGAMNRGQIQTCTAFLFQRRSMSEMCISGKKVFMPTGFDIKGDVTFCACLTPPSPDWARLEADFLSDR
jgi:hypothetical protein